MKTHTVKQYSVNDKAPGAALKAATAKGAKVREPHMIDTKYHCEHGGPAPAGKRKSY